VKDGEDAINEMIWRDLISSSRRLSLCEFIRQEEFLPEDQEMKKELLKFNRKRRNALVGGETGKNLKKIIS
jgi:hypothetical protein